MDSQGTDHRDVVLAYSATLHRLGVRATNAGADLHALGHREDFPTDPAKVAAELEAALRPVRSCLEEMATMTGEAP